MQVMGMSDLTQMANTGYTAGGDATMGKDAFLNLLVTQLQNQDPMNPTDSTEFTAQLAQFSELEGIENVNANLEDLKTLQINQSYTEAVSYIGKNVLAGGDTVFINDRVPEDVNFHLASEASTVYVSIYNPYGSLIDTIQTDGLSAGNHRIAWDGYDRSGYALPDGGYTFDVQAVDGSGDPVSSQSLITDAITGVNYTGGSPVLVTAARQIPLSEVFEVQEP
ncbi:MAG: hypothetical protein GY859_03645 [Desulfobacterales bacterium]|nr:hypothetical protein [Desulfobacterales bacterium]